MAKLTTGFVACDYSDGNMLSEVPSGDIRATVEEAARDARELNLQGVRWVDTDGYLHAEPLD